MDKALAAKTRKPLKKMVADEGCHAITGGANAAREEMEAEIRDIYQERANSEFLSKIRGAVARRN